MAKRLNIRNMGLVVSGWRWSSESNTGRIWSVKCAAAAAAKGRGNDESPRSCYNHVVDTLPSLSHSNPTWIHLPLILGWWRLVEAPDLAVLVHLARSVAQGVPGPAAHAPVAREAASLGDRFAWGLCWDLDQWNVAQWCRCLLPDPLKNRNWINCFLRSDFACLSLRRLPWLPKKPSNVPNCSHLQSWLPGPSHGLGPTEDMEGMGPGPGHGVLPSSKDFEGTNSTQRLGKNYITNYSKNSQSPLEWHTRPCLVLLGRTSRQCPSKSTNGVVVFPERETPFRTWRFQFLQCWIVCGTRFLESQFQAQRKNQQTLSGVAGSSPNHWHLVTFWWHFKPLPTLDHHPAKWWSWYDIRCLVGGQATMGSRTGAHLEPRLQGVLAGSRLLSEKCLIEKGNM